MSSRDGKDIVLRLNSQAVTALFPEGSQARVDLQQKLIDAAVKQVERKAVSGALEEKIVDAMGDINAVVEDKLKDYFTIKSPSTHWGSNTVCIKPAFVNELERGVEEEINRKAKEVVDNMVSSDKMEQKMRLVIESKVEHYTQQWIAKYVTAEMKKNIEEKVKEKVAAAFK